MWIHNLNPVLLDLGFAQIRWYGLVYVLGFLFSVWWLRWCAKKGVIKLNSEEIWDLMFYLMLGMLIGARVFELFWEPQHYLSNPLNLLKIWHGGMSFHGGLVGIIAAAYLYCRKKNLNFWEVTDLVSAPAMLALGFGRIANFINGELVGRVWNGTWCVVFPEVDAQCRHPSILYAAAYRFLIFGELLWLSLKSFQSKFQPGFIFWNFVLLEGLGRFIVDFYREDVLYLGFSLGQWFSVVMVIIAVVFLWKRHRGDFRLIL